MSEIRCTECGAECSAAYADYGDLVLCLPCDRKYDLDLDPVINPCPVCGCGLFDHTDEELAECNRGGY